MKIEFEVTMADVTDPTTLWAAGAVGLILFYFAVGTVMKAVPEFLSMESPMRFFVWAYSPFWVPIGIAALLIVGSVSIILWPISAGIVQPIWRWKD